MSEALSARPTKGGRIVLDTFRSAHDPMLRSWLHFRTLILAEADATLPRPLESTAGLGVFGVWRVLATNNRELGRCATLHASPAEALKDAEMAKLGAAQLSATVVRGTQPMTHGWVLRRDGHAVLTASRWYESASEANAAAKAARAAVDSAAVVGGVSIGTQSGRRHRRSLVASEPRD